MFLMWTGNEFQVAGPVTVNELSANHPCPSHNPNIKLVKVRGTLDPEFLDPNPYQILRCRIWPDPNSVITRLYQTGYICQLSLLGETVFQVWKHL